MNYEWSEKSWNFMLMFPNIYFKYSEHFSEYILDTLNIFFQPLTMTVGVLVNGMKQIDEKMKNDIRKIKILQIFIFICIIFCKF